MKISTIFAFVLYISVISCKNETPVKESAFDPSILDDKILDENGTLDLVIADSASTLYMISYKKLEGDSLAPYHLMKSADIQRNIPGKALMAIKKYDILKNKYPKHMLAPAALFMMGLTFDQNLSDKERSAKVYQDFLNRYPDHKMAGQARDLLAIAKDTSRSELDMVHEWMEK